MRAKIAMASVILFTLLVVGIAYAATVSIDSFNDGTQTLVVDSSTPIDSNVIDPPTAALGGERDVYLEWKSGTTGRINTDIDYAGTSERFAYTAGDGMKGQVTVSWDGHDNNAAVIDPQGLANVDLTGGSTNDGILATIINEDVRAKLTFRVYADTAGPNWSYSTVNLPPLNPGTRMDVFFPFSGFTTGEGTGAAFNNVGAVAMILDGTVDASVDVSVDFVEASSRREYGDLPVGTGTIGPGAYGTNMLLANHIPMGLRLGGNCDAETTYNSSTDALGDDNDQALPDDEDGVWPIFPMGKWCAGANCGWINVAPQGCANLGGCYIYGWIDWNGDGDFGETILGAPEQIVTNFNATSDGNQWRFFNTPTTFPNNSYYARFRICRTSAACDSPDNTDTNVLDGEVEDYVWYVGPTDVELGSFTATPQGKAIVLGWETLTEVDNLGFNLYRAVSPDGTQTKLNDALIPSKGLGSPIGFTYSFVDRTARPGRTYYYWLEAVDIYGGTTRYGPVPAAIPLLIGTPKTRQ